MHSENNELAKAGHELAKCLDSNTPLTEIAKLITRLATALDVTTLAVREATKQLDQVARAVGWVEGGNFTLAETVGGHVSGLKAAAQRSEELAGENATLKSYRPQPQGAAMMEALDAFYDREDVPEQGMMAAFEILCCKRPETPATDAYLAEVRAQGAEACVKALATSDDDDFTDAPNICACVAYQLRQGGAA